MSSERDHTTGGADQSFVDALEVSDLPALDSSDPFGGLDGLPPNGRSSRPDPGRTTEASSGPTSSSAPAPSGATAAGLASLATDGFAPNGTEDLDPSEDGHDPDHTRITRLDYGRHVRMLLVDTDPDSAAAFDRAGAESVLDVRLETATSIDDAIERLSRSATTLLRRARPDVVVLSLPTPEAHRFLEILRDDATHDDLPVIVLAESGASEAERRSFALGATAHLVAPSRDYERVALIHALPDFIPSARAIHASLEHGR